MTVDVGWTHVALCATDLNASARFYAKYAGFEIVHDRRDAASGHRVIWLSDKTRPFVLVLIEREKPDPQLLPIAHLGVACSSKEEVDRFAQMAREDGVLIGEPVDEGPPVGYYIFLRDPDGHSLELSYGQDVTGAVTP
ncbi:VOC family protein [Sneathiella glossodoripedis]|uniref:VOC family protein n=1 Tax=Sneathiella glossodoripedis TaxID=418853 RepID=UPI00056C8080|nr:VOC family protein [Sneathiella glossodoripedis]